MNIKKQKALEKAGWTFGGVQELLGEVIMPVYEYACPEHGDFELEQSILSVPVAACPECATLCERLISQTSFVLKGSGWTQKGS